MDRDIVEEGKPQLLTTRSDLFAVRIELVKDRISIGSGTVSKSPKITPKKALRARSTRVLRCWETDTQERGCPYIRLGLWMLGLCCVFPAPRVWEYQLGACASLYRITSTYWTL